LERFFHPQKFYVTAQFPQLTMARIETMMRRLSLLAGVVKLSTEVYQLTWKHTLASIMAIVATACNQSIELHRSAAVSIQTRNQSLHRINPFAMWPRFRTTVASSSMMMMGALIPKQ
jgi:hypothetical protein